jgi:hypothetical protein
LRRLDGSAFRGCCLLLRRIATAPERRAAPQTVVVARAFTGWCAAHLPVRGGATSAKSRSTPSVHRSTAIGSTVIQFLLRCCAGTQPTCLNPSGRTARGRCPGVVA